MTTKNWKNKKKKKIEYKKNILASILICMINAVEIRKKMSLKHTCTKKKNSQLNKLSLSLKGRPIACLGGVRHALLDRRYDLHIYIILVLTLLLKIGQIV